MVVPLKTKLSIDTKLLRDQYNYLISLLDSSDEKQPNKDEILGLISLVEGILDEVEKR